MSTIQLLRKAGLLIDELAKATSTPAELAKALEEPRSSIYRIVASLEETGYVRQVGDGKLELGATILKLGDSAASALVNRHGLREQLRWIKEQLGVGAFFAVQRDDQIICLDQVEGTDVDLLYLVPGNELPGHAGAASYTLLAYGPEESRTKLLAKDPFDPIAPQTPIAGDELSSRIEQASQLGWSFDDGELAEGVATVAVPVITQDGELVGTVAVAGLKTNLLSRKETIREVLASAAGTIAGLRVTSGKTVTRTNQADTHALSGKKSPSVIIKAAALMSVLESEKIATSTHITELLEEPGSSVFRMLSTLLEAGWVEQTGPRGAYRVGLKMLSLSEELLRRMDIRRIAAPTMQEIHQQTGETTFLCIRHDMNAVCIERIDGIRVNSRVLQLGKSLPLHVGAAPRALLAFDDHNAWEDYAAAAESTGNRWSSGSSRADLFKSLELEREQGYILSDNNVTPGIAAVGAPVYNHRNEVVASLSISGLREGIVPQTGQSFSAVDLVREGARDISISLGAKVDRHGVPARPTILNVSGVMG